MHTIERLQLSKL